MDTQKVIAACEKMASLRRAQLRKALLAHGMHLGQPEMLLYVQKHPGCSQRQMADDAGVTPASIAASFKRMENAGLIYRRQDTADTRCNRVYITEKGERELMRCLDDVDAVNAQMLRGIGHDELAALLQGVERINENLSE